MAKDVAVDKSIFEKGRMYYVEARRYDGNPSPAPVDDGYGLFKGFEKGFYEGEENLVLDVGFTTWHPCLNRVLVCREVPEGSNEHKRAMKKISANRSLKKNGNVSVEELAAIYRVGD